MPCQMHFAEVFACGYRRTCIAMYVTQMVMLVTCIHEITGANLCLDADYRERLFWVSSLPCGRRRDIILNTATTAPVHILSISL